MSTFADLKKAESDAEAVKATAAAALASATADDQHAALDVTATSTAYAAAVFAAPGHTVVYSSPLPVTIDQSLDGLTVTTTTVADSGDTVG